MTKDEKIKFVINTFESALPSYMNGRLGQIILKQDEIWLHRYVKSANFEDALQNDDTLENAYKAAFNISRM
ncbi:MULTISPECIES: hypothetical protein [unclassified Mesobacillus]|uniref:hypothetical protein n=1 Tax=unclassified Mesobacillus TaxID=2675270 RepID=UPI0020401EC1|nr:MULTISPECIES: hypothetical protein [unclassified Mesobacillus]MCM3122754.1 hypothetical protein [Mesobacillus sp. MER 33]MCM3232718.1 hypothetical protein [Mesobacillus sp. MER 48]